MSSVARTYTTDIDFAVLAIQDADFSKVLKPNRQLDFSDPASVLQLTKSLLKRDFGIQLVLPDDRLCPPVPNRQNYILWIQDLLDTTSKSYSNGYNLERRVLGLDVGTGASCIYPLLGCQQRPHWRFAGTDIDECSLDFARENVEINNLQDRIKLLRTQPNSPLLPLDQLGFQSIDFSMCNPPFYSSKDELLISAASKRRPPFSACTGSETEMVTQGGEIAFVSRMIEESLVLQDRVQWYTSMLGKQSSVAALVQKLKDRNIDNYAVTEFVQGSKTRRWGIAWSLGDLRPVTSVARSLSSLPRALLPFPSEYHITLGSKGTELNIDHRLHEILSQLPLKWMWKPEISTGIGLCNKPVWSRSARRHASKTYSEDYEMNENGIDEMSFGFKIHRKMQDHQNDDIKISIRWLKGHDSVLFESFCGMIKRKLNV